MSRPPAPRSRYHELSLREMIQDKDNSAMRIFRMYRNKKHYPHARRIRNIAWRIDSKKRIRLRQPVHLSQRQNVMTMAANTVESSIRVSAQDLHDSPASKPNENEQFDYANHLLQLRKQPPRHPHRESTAPLHPNPPLPQQQQILTTVRTAKSTWPLRQVRRESSSSPRAASSSPYQMSPNLHGGSISQDRAPSQGSPILRSNSVSRRLPYNETPPAKKSQQCSQCYTTSTPMWRQGANRLLLCNTCGLYQKIHGNPRTMKASRQREEDILANNTKLMMSASASVPNNMPTIHTNYYQMDIPLQSSYDQIVDFDGFLSTPMTQEFPNNLSDPCQVSQYTHPESNDQFRSSGHMAPKIGIDEIDNLLNANLFQSESFTVGNGNLTGDRPVLVPPLQSQSYQQTYLKFNEYPYPQMGIADELVPPDIHDFNNSFHRSPISYHDESSPGVASQYHDPSMLGWLDFQAPHPSQPQ